MNQGPIPGQSLTAPRGSAQYEKPAKHANPEAAFGEYVERLEDPDNREGLLSALELGTPLSSLVNILTREGTRKGYHSVDTAVILRPVLHEYLKTLAEMADIKVKETPTDGMKEKKMQEREKKILAAKVSKSLSEVGVEPAVEEMPEGEPEASVEEEQPKGLMRRRGNV